MRKYGYSYEWQEGDPLDLTEDGKTIRCESEDHVPMVVPGVVVDSSPREAELTASSDRDRRMASFDWEQQIPEWLQQFTEGLVV